MKDTLFANWGASSAKEKDTSQSHIILSPDDKMILYSALQAVADELRRILTNEKKPQAQD